LNYALLLTLLIIATSIAAALHALLNNRDSKAAFAWVSFCLILPLAGPVIYLVFGINRLQQSALKAYFATLEAEKSPSIKEPDGADLRPLSLVGEKVTGKGLRACTSVAMLENGEALYPDMLQKIRNAKTKVFLSSYIFDNDSIGDEFVQELCKAKDRNVDVRVIIDGLGEYMSFPRMGRKLRNCGLNFARFNPISLLPPSIHINMRNHRKILIVDSAVAYTGGQNIGERHMAAKTGNKHRVSDLHFRFTGKIVDELERAFLRDWYSCRNRREIISFNPANPNLQSADTWGRLVLDGPNEHLDRLNDLLVGIISAAKNRVWIMTPYFLPGQDIVAAILGARLRGIDVKILLPARNNIFLVHWAHQKILPYFLEKDIAVYFQPPPFIHTKALIIDENYSLIGSANMDARSLRLNFELGLEVFDKPLNQQLEAYFQEKITVAQQLNIDELKIVRLPQRIRNALAWLFSPYL